MTLLKSPEDFVAGASAQLAAPMLRLQRLGEAGHRDIKLAAGKCTLGSSPQCQIQLASPEVRPLQCLITLQDDVAQVTRWAAGVQLNGREFSKSTLNGGDRLTIGAWEIEFVTGQESVDPAAEAATTADDSPAEILGSTGPETVEARLESLASAASKLNEAEADSYDAGPAPATEAESLQTFQDKLVLHLWTANHTARRRAKSLITGIRAARFHADAMAADLSAIETELDLARAAYDCRLGNDERNQHELTERQSQQEHLIVPLQADIAGLRSQLVNAQHVIEQKTAAFNKAAAECEALRTAVADASATAALEARIGELEVELAAQLQKLASLTSDLDAAQQQQQRISALHLGAVERAAELEAQLLKQQSPKIEIGSDAPASGLAAVPASSQASTAADVWQNVSPLSAVEETEPAGPTTWQPFEAISAEVSTAAIIGPVTPIEPTPIPVAAQGTPTAVEIPPADAVRYEARAIDVAPAAVLPAPEPLQPVVREREETPAWGPVVEEPTKEFASTSFIDKYRHLLEEDDQATPALAKVGRPVIDDEFLSPSKVETCASASDESDEALEAYMANMMRRVRSSASQMGPASQVVAADVTPSLPTANSHSAAAEPESAYPMTPDFLAEEPLSFEDLRQATRKVPLARDLSALREIANSSARGAIATHSQRQTRESAITKLIVGITATVSAAYLMASAPEITGWQFWVGVATCAVGVTAAVQVLIIERRGRS